MSTVFCVFLEIMFFFWGLLFEIHKKTQLFPLSPPWNACAKPNRFTAHLGESCRLLTIMQFRLFLGNQYFQLYFNWRSGFSSSGPCKKYGTRQPQMRFFQGTLVLRLGLHALIPFFLCHSFSECIYIYNYGSHCFNINIGIN